MLHHIQRRFDHTDIKNTITTFYVLNRFPKILFQKIIDDPRLSCRQQVLKDFETCLLKFKDIFTNERYCQNLSEFCYIYLLYLIELETNPNSILNYIKDLINSQNPLSFKNLLILLIILQSNSLLLYPLILSIICYLMTFTIIFRKNSYYEEIIKKLKDGIMTEDLTQVLQMINYFEKNRFHDRTTDDQKNQMIINYIKSLKQIQKRQHTPTSSGLTPQPKRTRPPQSQTVSIATVDQKASMIQPFMFSFDLVHHTQIRDLQATRLGIDPQSLSVTIDSLLNLGSNLNNSGSSLMNIDSKQEVAAIDILDTMYLDDNYFSIDEIELIEEAVRIYYDESLSEEDKNIIIQDLVNSYENKDKLLSKIDQFLKTMPKQQIQQYEEVCKYAQILNKLKQIQLLKQSRHRLGRLSEKSIVKSSRSKGKKSQQQIQTSETLLRLFGSN
jgi:hypothetical protein